MTNINFLNDDFTLFFIIITFFLFISLDILISSLIHFNKIKNTKEFILQYLEELDRIIRENGSGGKDKNRKDFWNLHRLYLKKAVEKKDTLEFPYIHKMLYQASISKLRTELNNEIIIKELFRE